MGTLEEARKYFANDRYATEATGIIIDSIGQDTARCSLVLEDRHRNAIGGVMGGVIYTLADFAFAVASNFGREVNTVSVVGTASFLSATKGNILYAEAKLLKDGRSTCFYEVNVTDDLGRLIAVVNFNGAHISK